LQIAMFHFHHASAVSSLMMWSANIILKRYVDSCIRARVEGNPNPIEGNPTKVKLRTQLIQSNPILPISLTSKFIQSNPTSRQRKRTKLRLPLADPQAGKGGWSSPGGWAASSSGGLAGDQDGKVNLPWAAAVPELTVGWGRSGARSPWPAEDTHGAAGGALWGRARRRGCGRSDATGPQPAEHDCTRGGWHGARSSWGARELARMGLRWSTQAAGFFFASLVKSRMNWIILFLLCYEIHKPTKSKSNDILLLLKSNWIWIIVNPLPGIGG
jgi:hypothetical protein